MAVDLSGYEVFRKPYIPDKERLYLIFGGSRISANKNSVKALGNTMYVHILVNKTARRIVVEACAEPARDTFRWRTLGKELKTREIKCEAFSFLIYEMMNWNYGLKYFVEGAEEISGSGEKVLVFDLDNAEVRDAVRNDARLSSDKGFVAIEERGRTIELYENFSVVDVPIKVKKKETIENEGD